MEIGLIVWAIAVYLLAGFVKGLVGFALPTIGLGLMTVAIGVESAMALILVPTFVSNLWQALSGGNMKVLLRRLWPFFLFGALTLGFGTLILTKIEEGAVDLLLGILMLAYACPILLGATIEIPEKLERRVGVVAGMLNGVFSGLTGSYTFPGVMFLQAIGLRRDELVQAMGLLFLFSTIALGTSLQAFSLLEQRELLQSVFLTVPALIGLYAGQVLRKRVSEADFKRLVLLAICCLGCYLVPLGIFRLF